MINSENFKTWFGNSVTTNSQGKPIVFYHKSRHPKQFTEFKLQGVQKNPFNKHYGFWFVLPQHRHFIDHLGDGISVNAYLRIENPFNITQHANNKIVFQDGVDRPNICLTNDFCAELMERGHDGIIITQIGFYNQYVCFNPNQIKSVDNLGGFSKTDNNIFN